MHLASAIIFKKTSREHCEVVATTVTLERFKSQALCGITELV